MTAQFRAGRFEGPRATVDYLSHEFRDATFRADGPAFTLLREADTIVILSVERLPCRAVVEGEMGTGRAYRDPPILRPGDARTKRKELINEGPGFATVG